MISETYSKSKRLNISLHPEDIKQLDHICKWTSETRSGAIRRLINFKYISDKDKYKQG